MKVFTPGGYRKPAADAFGNQAQQKISDPAHPFGYGKELYFWNLIVFLLIFAVGGGMSFYEGIIHLIRPEPILHPLANCLVLEISMGAEGYSFSVALREMLRRKGKRGLWAQVHQNKDPAVYTVLFEDTAALVGLMIALLGVYLGEQFENPYFDGSASVLIGCLLMAVAVLLAYESRGLLIEEGVGKSKLLLLTEKVEEEPEVEKVLSFLTMCLGPHEILVNLKIRLKKISPHELGSVASRVESKMKSEESDIQRIFIEVVPGEESSPG